MHCAATWRWRAKFEASHRPGSASRVEWAALTAPVLALVLFVAVFALATLRGVHLGILMFVAACAVGPTVAGMTLREVMAGFPVGILILVAGVT